MQIIHYAALIDNQLFKGQSRAPSYCELLVPVSLQIPIDENKMSKFKITQLNSNALPFDKYRTCIAPPAAPCAASYANQCSGCCCTLCHTRRTCTWHRHHRISPPRTFSHRLALPRAPSGDGLYETLYRTRDTRTSSAARSRGVCGVR